MRGSWLRLVPWTVLVVSLWLAPARAGAQSVCDPPQVLLTVDKSSSMLGELPSGLTKWEAARMAVAEVTGSFEDRIHFGLQPFPFPNECNPGVVTVAIGDNTSEEIVAGLGDPPPTGGNYTPMAQSLDAAAEYGPLTDPAHSNHLILITDGWQWCDPYDPDTRFDPVEAVGRLRDLGVTVHVVGFGAAVDSLTLNRAAVAAGTALPGCDETATEPSDPDHCYMQADDLSELSSFLDDIGTSITEEVCDDADNDCDGRVDEGFDGDGDGVATCEGDCDDSDPDVHPEAEETCDGVDNDCDGTTDPGCGCETDSRECGTDEGICETGTQFCEDGEWSLCMGGVSASGTDRCDGEDGDCDGEIDEDDTCGAGGACRDGRCVDLTEPSDPGEPVDPEGEQTTCTDGEMRPCLSNVGICEFGTGVCREGEWTECSGGIGPLDEDLCDGEDGDCDNEIDEDADCGAGQTCRMGRCVVPDDGGSGSVDAGGPPTGADPPPEDGGCGCASTARGAGAGGASGALLGLLALAWLLRRRR